MPTITSEREQREMTVIDAAPSSVYKLIDARIRASIDTAKIPFVEYDTSLRTDHPFDDDFQSPS